MSNKVIDLPILKDRGAGGDAMSRRPAVIRETMQAGVYHRAMQDSTAIDVAHRQGWLGPDGSDEAKWRLEAGLWLRRTYERAGLRQRESGSYQPRSEGAAEISDAEAWNLKVYNEAPAVVGTATWPRLRAFIVDDAAPPPQGRAEILAGLDRLACHRGLVPSNHPEYGRLAAILGAHGVASWRG
jgi:hypothetical protein